MKFLIEKNELLSIIIPAYAASASKATLPALEGLLLSVKDDELTVSGYDLEKGVRAVGVIRNGEDGEIIINAQKFVAIVRSMPDGEDISFVADDKNNAVVKSGFAEFNIHGLPGNMFPTLPLLDNETVFSIPQKKLREMLTSTLFAVAQSESRPIFTGEYFIIDGADITIVALDGVRMAVRLAKGIIKGNDSSYRAVVPGKALNELIKLLNDDEKDVLVSLTRKNIIFKFDSTILFTRLLEGEFLDYENLIPKEPKIFVTVDTIPFLDSIERVSLMVDDKLKPPVRCMIEDSTIEVSCSNQFGKVTDFVPVKKTGDDIEIGLDNRYLIDVLRACKVDTLHMELTTAFMGVVIKPAEAKDDDRFIYVIAPRRLR